MTNRERIESIVNKDLGLDQDISDDANLMDDLGADSLDVVGIVIGIENEFNIEIGDDAAINLKTFGDLVTYVTGRVGE